MFTAKLLWFHNSKENISRTSLRLRFTRRLPGSFCTLALTGSHVKNNNLWSVTLYEGSMHHIKFVFHDDPPLHLYTQFLSVKSTIRLLLCSTVEKTWVSQISTVSTNSASPHRTKERSKIFYWDFDTMRDSALMQLNRSQQIRSVGFHSSNTSWSLVT
jgi:hypothetical protein